MVARLVTLIELSLRSTGGRGTIATRLFRRILRQQGVRRSSRDSAPGGDTYFEFPVLGDSRRRGGDLLDDRRERL